MLLAAVLVVGFIGISNPSNIFAQYYDEDYEKSYEKYMKDDYSKPSIQKISCNNINKNPSDKHIESNALDLPDENSKSDRMNANKKENFVYVYQNNNTNIFNIENLSVDIENNPDNQTINLTQELNCTNNNFNGLINIGCNNLVNSTIGIGEFQSPPDTITTEDTISSSSNYNDEQTSVQSQNIAFKNLNGIKLQQKEIYQ